MAREESIDVAIVGGGVAGVYAAWRLISAPPGSKPVHPKNKPSIALFESDRIGGRLLSLVPPGMPHIVCELGGMRYMSTHTLVRSLVENKLKLATESLPVDVPQNIAYLRGHHLRLSDLGNGTLVPYGLSWAESGKTVGGLLVGAINQIVPGITQTASSTWPQLLYAANFDGRPIWQQGFWNLMARVLSTEAYAFVRDGCGYDCLVSNYNAAEAILMLLADFPPGVTYSRVVAGYDTVPKLLCEQFQSGGGDLRVGWRLKAFESLSDASSGVRLTFHGQRETIVARRLVLALPRRAIELLDPVGPLLDPKQAGAFPDLLNSVEPIPLFKIFLAYDYPWWTAAGVTSGRSLTNLPLRQTYYWGVEGQQTGGDPRNTNSAMLASYDDESSVSFWEGLRDLKRHPRYSGVANSFAAAAPGSSDWQRYAAPAPMVKEVQRQLVEMHGLAFAPEPYTAAYRDWSEDPFGGGVHLWNIHYQSGQVVPRMIHPKAGVPIFICGEAWSHQQGWVEGALETAEEMLEKHFHLAPPTWITPPKQAMAAA